MTRGDNYAGRMHRSDAGCREVPDSSSPRPGPHGTRLTKPSRLMLFGRKAPMKRRWLKTKTAAIGSFPSQPQSIQGCSTLATFRPADRHQMRQVMDAQREIALLRNSKQGVADRSTTTSTGTRRGLGTTRWAESCLASDEQRPMGNEQRG